MSLDPIMSADDSHSALVSKLANVVRAKRRIVASGKFSGDKDAVMLRTILSNLFTLCFRIYHYMRPQIHVHSIKFGESRSSCLEVPLFGDVR